MRRRVTILAVVLCGRLPAMAADPAGLETAFFESKVRPLLAEHCYSCHSGSKTKGGLSLDTREGWSKGGDSGPALVPGNPEDSLLIKAVRHASADLAMPPEKSAGKLSGAEIQALEEWVRMGAPDPRETAEKIAGMAAGEARGWWAFQPLPAPGPAGALTAERINAAIDARLTAAGLQASPPADKHTLIGRAGFDLTALPLTPDAVSAFVANTAPDAFTALVDAVRDKVHGHDLHATILHLMGLYHERLVYRYGGRDYRLTDVSGQVVKAILS